MSSSQLDDPTVNFKDREALLAEIARVDDQIAELSEILGGQQPDPFPGPSRFGDAANRVMLRFCQEYRKRLARRL